MSEEANHYVNNRELLEYMKDYKRKVNERNRDGLSKPIIDSRIGYAIMQIAEKIATRREFSGYPFREEMISGGVENCIRYIDNFNPDKWSNPYGYFSRIIWHSFWQKIKKEKEYLYTKYKLLIKHNIHREEGEEDIQQSEFAEDYMNEFIRKFEESKKRKENKEAIPDKEPVIRKKKKPPIQWKRGEQADLIREFMERKSNDNNVNRSPGSGPELDSSNERSQDTDLSAS